MEKNEKYIWYLLTIGLIVCNIFVLVNLHKKTKLISVCNDNWQKSQYKNTTLTNYFLDREKKCVESENFPLPGQLILKGLDGSSHLLKEKIIQSSKLFFRFSASNCQTCIDIEIQRMVKYLNNVNPDKIVILVSDKDVDYLNYFKKNYGFKYEIFLVKRENIRIPMEQYNIPYLFVLTPDGRTNSVFIPERNENKFSEQYYNLIKNVL